MWDQSYNGNSLGLIARPARTYSSAPRRALACQR